MLNNNLKNQGEQFRDYFNVDINGNLQTSNNLTVPTLNCDTINATNENIINKNNYNVSGYVRATDEITAFYGTPNAVSMSGLKSNIDSQITNVSTLQSQMITANSNINTNSSNISTLQSQMITANSNISTNSSNISTLQNQVSSNTSLLVNKVNKNGDTMTGNFTYNDDEGYGAILVRPDGYESNLNPGLLVGRKTAGPTGFIETYTINNNTLNSNTINNTGDVNIYDNSNNLKIAFRPNATTSQMLDVDGTIFCDKIQVRESGGVPTIPLSVVSSGSTLFEVNSDGRITGTSLRLINTDVTINGSDGSFSLLDGTLRNVRVNNITSLGSLNISGNSNLSNVNINGNLNVFGGSFTSQSVINQFTSMSIIMNPAGNIPALGIQQTGGTGAIMEVLDNDSNIRFQINQDCDINLNNKFNVDSLTGVINAGDIGTTNCSSLNNLNQTVINNGTTLSTLSSLIQGSVNNKTIYVSKNGNDANNGYSIEYSVLTLSRAYDLIDGSGWQVIVLPGTYNESVTIPNPKTNSTLLSLNTDRGGIVNITGTLNFNHSTSSIRVVGISVGTIHHQSTGGLYLENVKVNTNLTSFSSGYLQVLNCDLQGGSGTTTTLISGSGLKVFGNATTIAFLTINNASANVNLSNLLICGPITVTLGTIGINNSPVYSANLAGNSITMASSCVGIFQNVTCLTPSNTLARVNFASGSSYSERGLVYDRTNSTLSTRLTTNVFYDSLVATNLQITGNTSFTSVPSGPLFSIQASGQSAINISGGTNFTLAGVSGISILNLNNGLQIGTNGGSFNPTISNLTTGDTLYYDGTNWVNGYYIDAPSLTATNRTLQASGLSTPFNLTGQFVQYQIYNNAGNTLLYDSGNLAINSSYTQNALSGGVTYKGRARNKATRANSISPWSGFLNFTPTNDAIAQQLTTSLSAYNSAPVNSLVQITATEYSNIISNLSSMQTVVNLAGIGSNSSFANLAYCQYQYGGVNIGNKLYLVVMQFNSSGSNPADGNSFVSIANNTTQSPAGNYYPINTSSFSGTTFGTAIYCCWKAPTILVGDTNLTNYAHFIHNSQSPIVTTSQGVLTGTTSFGSANSRFPPLGSPVAYTSFGQALRIENVSLWGTSVQQW